MFNLREYLIENLETEVFDIDILDKISRNIDLNNRLYIIYDSKINKPVDNTELSEIDYIRLLKTLIRSNDFKLLNSACKLNDFLYSANKISLIEHTNILDSIKQKIIQ